MNLVEASIVVMSHLSDAQVIVGTNIEQANRHINFAKYVILKTDGNLMQEINPNVLWNELN